MLYIGTMSTLKATKINHLLRSQPQGSVMLSSWLNKQGYSLDLQKRYRKSHWLESIGTGAMIRAGDQVTYQGAIYALQKQSGLTIHPGGKTALSLLGKAHYLEMSQTKIVLFGNTKERLPTWFKKHDWDVSVDYYQSSFLPSNLGLIDLELKTFSIKISGAARALMECLFLTPEKQALFECYELMEGLNNLRPDHVQILLEACKSVKVKRLFMFMAEKTGHDWINYLDLKKVDFGKGKRSFVANGTYVSKYQITVPKEFKKHDHANL